MNPILVISSDPDNTVEYLKQAGYDALPVYANDMALDMAKKNQSNTVLYYTTVGPVEHEHILKMLREAVCCPHYYRRGHGPVTPKWPPP